MDKEGTSLQGFGFGSAILAMDKVKSGGMKGKNDKPKGGDLGDLFKCTKAMADATTALSEYLSGEADEYVQELEKYRDALIKIQTGMLEIAKKKVTNIRGSVAEAAPVVPAPTDTAVPPAM